jgi:superfamily II DNA/RNA helicase
VDLGALLNFAELGIDQDICDALASRGITSPFPIQEQAIPLALTGQDIIGQAKTGTGKTLGFGLPLLQSLGLNPEKGAKALVVVPTRELAIQVAEDLKLASSNRSTMVAAIYGGKAYEEQVAEINAGAQVIVGTPGRLIDLSKQKLLDLGNIRFMVLDEADEMLDLGFLPDVERLFAYTPDGRQTMLFSATMPGTIVTMARKYQNRPVHIAPTTQMKATLKPTSSSMSTVRTRWTKTKLLAASCRPKVAARLLFSPRPSVRPARFLKNS